MLGKNALFFSKIQAIKTLVLGSHCKFSSRQITLTLVKHVSLLKQTSARPSLLKRLLKLQKQPRNSFTTTCSHKPQHLYLSTSIYLMCNINVISLIFVGIHIHNVRIHCCTFRHTEMYNICILTVSKTQSRPF